MRPFAEAQVERPDQASRLEIAERPRFQVWFWGVQRLSWGGLGIAIALGLLGLSGAGGLWSQRISKSADAFVTYPAVLRIERPERITILTAQGEVVLDPAFLEVFDITYILPVPKSQSSINRSLSLTFDGIGELMIEMSVIPTKASGQPLRLKVGTEWHDLEMTILP